MAEGFLKNRGLVFEATSFGGSHILGRKGA
jgi:hypothetical protein